jgi:heme-degrading monooxygenase HmoA
MIARVWRGITSISKADQYLEYLNQVVLPGYQAVDGNQGVYIFREVQGELVYFLLLSIWSSYDALTKFAGPNLEIAKQAPEEQKFLIASESVVTHYEVLKIILPDINLSLRPET